MYKILISFIVVLFSVGASAIDPANIDETCTDGTQRFDPASGPYDAKDGLRFCTPWQILVEGSLADVDGFFAVLLWNDYKSKRNEKSLETLLSYNIEDVLNLEYLMIEAYNRKLRDIPFKLDGLSIPVTPENPFAIDASTVKRIQSQYYSY